ncbi:SAV_2336 N-terminal domain-related protein [Streptomyces sp. NPDC004647]|uniref:SAV_2336 N-terminal domain-related protein n=1 Tax=Streptomyces sp. NPDC004647 TaxID=3154671 RepID=UPI00339E65E7
MTAPPDRRLREVIGLLRAAGWDVTAEEVADALWLARWTDGSGPAALPSQRLPDDPAVADPQPEGHPPEATALGSSRRRSPQQEQAAGAVPVSLYPAGSGRTAGEPRTAFPVRAPAAAALPGLLGLQRALRPLRRYRPLATPVLDGLDEDATADLSARAGTLWPVFSRVERRDIGMHLLMDASPSMVVWERMLEELRQTCEQLGVFRDVAVHYLHHGRDGAPLVGNAPGPPDSPGVRLRPADQLRDPTGRRLTLLISDCVGPLWREGRAQRLLHQWSLHAPVAVVQPLPPRLWGRTALPAGPGLLVRDPGSGGRLGFRPQGYGPLAGPPGPAALPVPVLLPNQEALGSWAGLLSGVGRVTARGAAGWVLPDHPVSVPEPRERGAGSADELVEAFRATASAGALRLAVHLAAAPLALPVMQVVQRAMLPDTGPTELAEVLLGGLLHRLPDPPGDPDAGPWYEFADGVRNLLLQSLGRDEATLVLKHCSEFVSQHFGKGARNFSALAVAQLSGRAVRPPREPAEDRPGTRPQPEPFAEVPARVVRWFQPLPQDPAGAGPVAEAERLMTAYRTDGDARLLLDAVQLMRGAAAAEGAQEQEHTTLARGLLMLWQAQADPALLHEARDRAEQAVRLAGRDPGSGTRARLVLGRVLRVLAGAASGGVRRDTPPVRELLDLAAVRLEQARDLAAPGSEQHTEAALELAAVRYALWQENKDSVQLTAAERVLRALPSPSGPERHLQLGRVLLALAGTGEDAGRRAAEAADELRAGCDLLASPDTRLDTPLDTALGTLPGATPAETPAGHPADGDPDARLCTALLDLAAALPMAGREAAEVLPVLARAEAAAGGDDGLRLRCLLARARTCSAAGSRAEAASSYAAAASLTRRNTRQRREVLAEWGELLLGQALADGRRPSIERAEEVLREAVAETPASDPLTDRLNLLLGRVLALRFHEVRHLPDLYEGSYLLERAARRAEDGWVRAEAWLELGSARRAFHAQPTGPPQAAAAVAYARAAEEAARAAGGEAGSVLAARALHRRGQVLELTEGHAAALESYRAAAREWRRLASGLAEVDWGEVEATRARIRELESG